MNIITVRKALRACNHKTGLLQERRERAKDKPRWDKKNGDGLGVLLRQQTRLTELLLGELARQGQFRHDPRFNAPADESDYNDV